MLTAFGSQVGFANSLEASLDQTFGGDSAATLAGQTGVDGDGGDQQSTGPVSAQDKLNQALVDAANAMTASQEAMTAGDWEAYGAAQDKLDQAINQAVEAQLELGQDVSGATIPGADGAQSGAVAPEDGDSQG